MAVRGSPARTTRIVTLATMLSPSLIVVAAVMGFPLAFAFVRSLERREAFVGLQNYTTLLADPTIQTVIVRTALFVIVCAAFELLLGTTYALLLNREFPGRGVVRTLFLVPLLVPPVIAALNWSFLLNPQFGAVNQLLRYVLPPHLIPLWLADPTWAFVAVIIVTVWRNTPFVMILILAGLQSIAREMYEAAFIDGASRLQALRYVTLPSLRQVILVALMLRVIDLFRVFDTVFVMTQGGPGGATDILSTRIYKMAFWEGQTGPAAALSYIALLITLMLLVPLLTLSRRRVD